MATTWTVGADALDPQRLARFWASALGYVIEPGFDDEAHCSIVDPENRLPAIGFLRVPESKTAKNRLHLDVRPAPDAEPVERERRIRATVVELGEAGATEVRTEFYGPEFGHVVLTDPEGNEFCVA